MKYDIKDLIPIVQNLAEKYTNKQSTSVTYETAQQLMGAVIYCINEAKFSKEQEDQVETTLVNQNSKMSAKEAYELGYKLSIKKFLKANDLYIDIRKDFRSYQNIAYYDTVIKGIPVFFESYDIKFYPQNHIITLDYPILDNLLNISGIDAIYKYLICIYMEQIFLKFFPDHYIRTVLISYHNQYENLFLNISSVILRKILACMILEKNISKIDFDSIDYQKIDKFLKCYKKEVIENKVIELLTILIQKNYTGNLQLFQYLKKDIPNFITELINAANYNCLCNIL